MLHEIFLSLSGIPSPILENIKLNERSAKDQDGLDPYISQPERDMLKTLATLADLQTKVKEKCISLSTSHPAPICRAISASIRTTHLQAFTKKVLEVESSILQKDSAYVGAYRSVPLSTLLTEFQPWSRPLRWLWKTLQLLTLDCSTRTLFQYLQGECQTGYSDLRDIATALLITAQQAWANSLMPWLLFGELPHTGKDNFMIRASSVNGEDDFIVDFDQVPYFVSEDTIESIIAIGKALSQIRSRNWLKAGSGSQHNTLPSLLPSSLEKVKSLVYPIKANDLDHVVEYIDTKLSETALTQFLPADMILDLLLTAKQFLLLQDSDFAIALVEQAGRHLQTRSSATSTKAVRKLGRLEDFKISEAELSTILENTWSELPAAASEHAVACIRLTSDIPAAPVNLLLPTSAGLMLRLPSASPLHMFMSKSDIRKYVDISAYLISLQRAKLLTIDLWSRPGLRRRTQISLIRAKRCIGKAVREREDQRANLVRPYWICASQIVLLLSELTTYLHGEVIENSWSVFRSWLEEQNDSRPSSSRFSSRPTTASSRLYAMSLADREFNSIKTSTRSRNRRNDPRVLARAHRVYLDTLYRMLLLGNKSYLSILRDLLNSVNHFVALFYRIQVVWQALDHQQDQLIMNAFSDYSKEEQELVDELKRTNANIIDSVHDLIGSIRDAEQQRDITDLKTGLAEVSLRTDGDDFSPWTARSLDRLLMKLDSLAGDEREDTFEDAIVGNED